MNTPKPHIRKTVAHKTAWVCYVPVDRKGGRVKSPHHSSRYYAGYGGTPQAAYLHFIWLNKIG